MKIFYFATGLILLINCCTSRQNNDQLQQTRLTDVEKLLTGLVNDYYDDMSRRDWSAYRTYFWDNATITTVWQAPDDSIAQVHVITIDEFIAQTPNGPDSQPIFEEQPTTIRTDIQGNLAVVWADYDAKFGSQDSLMTWSGTDMFSFLRSNNEWKIVSLTFEPEQDP